MLIEIPGQLRGPECRAVARVATAIRKDLEPIFHPIEIKVCSKLSVVLRVGGSLGEFEWEPGDGQLRFERGELVYDLLIQDHRWAGLTDAEIRQIVCSHLLVVLMQICEFLGLDADVSARVRDVVQDR